MSHNRFEAGRQTDIVHVCFGGLGGHAGVIQPLTKELAERGVRSTVCLYASPDELKRSSTWSSHVQTVSVPKQGRIDPRGLAAIARIIRGERPRVVLCHTHQPVIAAVAGQLWAAMSPRVIVVEHQSIGLRSKVDQAKSFLALPLSRSVIVLSQDYAARYPYRSVPIKAIDRMTVIPNGVDLDIYRPVKPKKAEIDPITIGMLSRLTPTKDVATLIRAAAILARDGGVGHFRLRIAGDGPEREKLEALVREHDLGQVVEFVGTLGEREVILFLQGLDLYVHATHGETLSTAILQAYATGLPIMASKVEGVRNLICDGQDGVLVDARSPEEWAVHLTELIGDRERRVVLGRAARVRAEIEFGVSLMADKYLSLFAEIDPHGGWASDVQRKKSEGSKSSTFPQDELAKELRCR